MKPCPHATDSGKTTFSKLLIIIFIRAMQALSSFQSGVATLLKIWVFLQFLSTHLLMSRKTFFRRTTTKKAKHPSSYSSRVRTTIKTLQAKNSRKQPKSNQK